jgi:hypothetical protein
MLEFNFHQRFGVFRSGRIAAPAMSPEVRIADCRDHAYI